MNGTDQRQSQRAEVAELVDALGSGSSRGFPVGVRVSPSAPLIFLTIRYNFRYESLVFLKTAIFRRSTRH